ncbi:hypothetical protein BJ742DRAFT_873736 [Cladochytrium replicatum]|nr:hypothetical protein BJ742DRAFT_873736 [Cladochytrium replicatum]
MQIKFIAAVLAIAPIAAARITKIVSFGDSLTDTGACAALTRNNGPVIPSNAYFKNHFSNGAVWLEYVTSAKKLAVTNFAVGGATTSDALVQGWVGGKFGEPLRKDGSIQQVPGADKQIQAYLKKPDAAKADILYTIFVGANDNFDNQLLGLGKDAAFFANAQTGLWKSLLACGARQILAIVLPKELDPFYALYGSTIDAQIAKIQKSLPIGTKLFKYEVPIAAFVATSYTPNLTPSPAQCCTDCFNGLPPVGNATVCANGNSFLIWDGLHPTTVVHKFIADDITKFIQTKFGF